MLSQGDAADGVTYQWSCPDGGSFTGDTTARGARWQAPTTPGTYTLKCVINDTPTAIAADETGTRDDPNDLEQTVTVQVVPDEPPSIAKLKLYPDVNGAPGPVEKYDPIGGAMWGVLEVWVGAGQEVDPNLSNVTLRLEEDSTLHTEADNHLNKTVDFTTYMGWEKWDGTQWLALQPGETPKATSPLAGGVKYRWKFPWATTTKANGDSASVLLGHNEEHVFSLTQVNGASGNTISFQDGNNNLYASGPRTQTANVQNLVIENVTTNAGNPDYFKFDKDSSDDSLSHPVIHFSIKDQGDTSVRSNRFHWTLWVRETTINGPSNFVTYDGDAEKPGPQTVTINQDGDGQDGSNYHKTSGADLTNWGTYAFDIRVSEVSPQGVYGDSQILRSDKISIPSWMVDSQGNPLIDESGKPIVDAQGHIRAGHSLDPWSDGKDYKLKASYLLQGDRDASKMETDLIDPNLRTLSTVMGGTKVAHPYLGQDSYVLPDSEPIGDYKGVFVATDAHAADYRNHRNKAMLAVNDTKNPPTADNYHWVISEPYPLTHIPINIWNRYHADEIAKEINL